MPDKQEILLTQQSEPYRPTLEAIHALFPLANVPEKKVFLMVHYFHMLCEHFDANAAYDLLHLMFGRKRK
jgi:hypothetical protein